MFAISTPARHAIATPSPVASGIYHFAGLPLKIASGDGAPMRAILWRD
jgi:kynurenine formamidase